MEIRKISDDFFMIGNIAILYRKTGNSVYDFNFRNYFECKSVVSCVDEPILLHIGAVEDYAAVETMIEDMGMKLLVKEAEHLRCSNIENWYPALEGLTPYTEIYESLPNVEIVLNHFQFPIFIKGTRQTSRHEKSKCIIENIEDYKNLKNLWEKDPILSWQKVAIREYVQLKVVDDVSYPDMVPICYEFRFFCFEGKCVGCGPYWYMGNMYAMNSDEYSSAIELAQMAAERVGATFIAVDLAKTVDGEWIIIEVNDAQESGFVGINSLSLWQNAIDAMQNRNWISVDELFDDYTVILASDPAPNVSIDEMRTIAKDAKTEKELADAYATAINKAKYVCNDIYLYDEGSKDFKDACEIADAWFEVADAIKYKIFEVLDLCCDNLSEYEYMEEIKIFMEHNNYIDGRDWWVEKDYINSSGKTGIEII